MEKRETSQHDRDRYEYYCNQKPINVHQKKVVREKAPLNRVEVEYMSLGAIAELDPSYLINE